MRAGEGAVGPATAAHDGLCPPRRCGLGHTVASGPSQRSERPSGVDRCSPPLLPVGPGQRPLVAAATLIGAGAAWPAGWVWLSAPRSPNAVTSATAATAALVDRRGAGGGGGPAASPPRGREYGGGGRGG